MRSRTAELNPAYAELRHTPGGNCANQPAPEENLANYLLGWETGEFTP